MKNGFKAKIGIILMLSAMFLAGCEGKNDVSDTKNNQTEDVITAPESQNTTTPTEDEAENTAAEKGYADIPTITKITVTDETPGDYFGIYAMSDGIFKVANKDFSIGLMNSDGKLLMPCEYSTCRSIKNGVTAVRDDLGMWSYFNVEEGRFTVENADSLFDFSEGIGCFYDDEVYRFVNPDGSAAIDGTFFEAAPFSDGLARVLTSDAFGYMDKTGKIVIHSDYNHFDDFHNGMARVHNGERFGYIGKDGKLKFFMDCTAIFNYKDGLAAFTVGRKIGYIDKDGRVSAEPLYERPYQEDDEYYRFECGVAPVVKDGKYGFINKDGELVIDAVYDNAMYAVDGIIRVQKDKLFGYVTTDGKIITDCIFNDAGVFCEGVAKVMKDGKYFFINKEGTELTSERFEDATDFCGNTAFVVKQGTDTWYKVTISG